MPKRKATDKKHWSYNAGERGRNWVRAFRQRRDGRYYVEWRDEGKRRALLLRGVTSIAEAKAKADELAAKFADLTERPEEAITLRDLLALYLKEVTPTKGSNAMPDHEQRARTVWVAFFDAQEEVARRSSRLPRTLDRIDWDRFIGWRRSGEMPGRSSVKDRAIQRDLKHMITVLNWAVGAKLIAANPWGTEIRRVQRWVMPKEKNPRRPSMTEDLRAGLIAHSRAWQLPAMLVLERETRRRNNSIRQLLWSDIDQDRWTVRWRSDTDKAGRESITPLTETAIDVLKGLPSRGIGNAPVFPAAQNPSQPVSSKTAASWLYRAKRAWRWQATPEGEREALREALRGVGFHAELRAGVRDPEFRRLSPKVQEEIAGKSYEMLKNTYDEVTISDMRDEGRGLGIPGSAEGSA